MDSLLQPSARYSESQLPEHMIINWIDDSRCMILSASYLYQVRVALMLHKLDSSTFKMEHKT